MPTTKQGSGNINTLGGKSLFNNIISGTMIG
jgi:hypothetical protein